MSNLTRSAAIAVLCVLSPAALAADDVGAIPSIQQGIATGATALIVFAISAVFLGVVVWPRLSAALEERAAKIREEITAAEQARQQAREALRDYEQSLTEARADAQRMLDEAKSKQTQLAADLRAKSDRELNMMRTKALRDIEAAKRAALNEIYEETLALATSMASKILEREVSASDHERLVEESLAELQSTQS